MKAVAAISATIRRFAPVLAICTVALTGCKSVDTNGSDDQSASRDTFKKTSSVDRIVDYFDTIVFGSQFGPRYEAKVIAKWQGLVGIDLQGKVTEELTVLALTHVQTLEKITGLKFKQVDRTANVQSISLIFVKRAEMGRIPVPAEYRAVMKRAAVNANCYFLSWKKPESRIVKAIIVADVERDILTLNSCLLEHLTQTLGLPNNSDTFRPSIFSDRDQLFELAPQDKILLKTLYHPDMKPGYIREQAKMTARAIISRMATKEHNWITGAN